MTALYLHIPFCRRRCPYCDFATAPYTAFAAHRLGEAICREAAHLAPALGATRFETLFLGGGTPSRLDPRDFRRLVTGLRRELSFADRLEFTLEANPEDADGERLESWREEGVNRVSLGVQSLDEAELRRLGRSHGAARAREAARQVAGLFESWSVDLMFAFPGHVVERWQETLAAGLALGPPHLSLYQFTAEPGTTLGESVRAGRIAGIDEEDSIAMYDAAREACAAHGLEHYEVSNFARPGHRSRHNLAYWKRRPYLGLGPSAVSLGRGRRWRNLSEAGRYTEAVLAGGPWVEEVDCVTGKEGMETVMLGLRLEEGIRWSEMPVSGGERRAWREAAGRLARDGLVTADGNGVRIPADYRRVADSIILRLWEEMERCGDRSAFR